MLTSAETAWRTTADALVTAIENHGDEPTIPNSLAYAVLALTAELAHHRALLAMEPLLDRRAAAEHLSVSVDQVTLLVDAGLLPACEAGTSRAKRTLRFSLDQLREFTKRASTDPRVQRMMRPTLDLKPRVVPA